MNVLYSKGVGHVIRLDKPHRMESSDMEIIDYEILVKNLIPPMGDGKEYYAVIQFLVVKTTEGNKHVDLDLGETHGKTAAEARSKMQDKFDNWRQSNT